MTIRREALRCYIRVLFAGAFAFATCTAVAENEWIIPVIPKDFSTLEKHKYAFGNIGGQKYLVAQFPLEECNLLGGHYVFLVAKISKRNNYESVIASNDTFSGLSRYVAIRSGAIVVGDIIAHHGLWDGSLQFRPSGKTFVLTAFEHRSSTLSDSGHRRAGKRDIWNGSPVEMENTTRVDFTRSVAFHSATVTGPPRGSKGGIKLSASRTQTFVTKKHLTLQEMANTEYPFSYELEKFTTLRGYYNDQLQFVTQ